MNLRYFRLITNLLGMLALASTAKAVTTNFFNATQTATVVVSNVNAVTIQSGDYRFTYSADGYWSAGGGTPTGRFFSVSWPAGVQAQAVTTGPLLGTGANITLKRADGKPFGLQAFTGRILLNTAGAGGAFEIMPKRDGNDAFQDPLQYDCTGYAGSSYSYTTALSGYDTYQIHMWGDFALSALTIIDPNPPLPPAVSFAVTASAAPVTGGTVGGVGSYPSNSTCSLVASPNPGWGFRNWTENNVQVGASSTLNLTVRSDRALVANFVPAYTLATEASPGYGGSVSGAGSFNSNSLVLVSATPITGFKFANWSEAGTVLSTSANYRFNLTSNRSLIANFIPAGTGATFDFDTGSPLLLAGQSLPASQTKNGVTATFSTTAGGWSVQNNFYFWVPSLFSGNFLYPTTWGSALAVEFSQPVTNFTASFMTGEVSSEYDVAGLIKASAYADSAMTMLVSSGSARGAWISGAYPEGVLSFGSATAFTKVRIEVPAQSPAPSSLFFVDNIVVQLAEPLPPHAPPVALGGHFYQMSGQALAINIADLTWSDYDPDGEPVFFVGVSPKTTNGLALMVDNGRILVPANTLSDGFTYTIADDSGVTARGSATISIIDKPGSRTLSLDFNVPGAVNVQFTGVPWFSYTAQRATNATFTGTLRTWPVAAWEDGSCSVLDDFADLDAHPAEAYYRLCYP